MQHDIVTIVYGGGDYHEIAPPNSYVDTRNFESPRALAHYLMKLHLNDTLHNEYFLWKNEYYIEAGVYQMARKLILRIV